MGGCLVRDEVGADASPHEFRENVSGIAAQANRLGVSGFCPHVDEGERFIEAVGFLV